MSDPIIIQLKRFVRDLLPHPEDLIKSGRVTLTAKSSR